MSAAEQIEQRLASLRAELVAAGLDGAVIVQNTDLAYFTGTNQQAHLIVPAAGEPRLLVRRTLERARVESPLTEIDSLKSLSGLAPALAQAGLGAGTHIGFELDVLPAKTYLGYGRRLEGYRLGDASPAIAAVRSRKSPEDIAEMRLAAAQVDAATRAVPGLLEQGITESQVQVEVESILRRAGHQGLMRYRGFNQELHFGQVLSGASGAVGGYSDSPLCGPGPNRVIGKGAGQQRLAVGDPVIVDLVGASNGWLADQTRTFFLGRRPPTCAMPTRSRSRCCAPSRPSCGPAPSPRSCSRWPSGWPPTPASPTTSWAPVPTGYGFSDTGWAWRSTRRRCSPRGSTRRWSKATWWRSSPSSCSPAGGRWGSRTPTRSPRRLRHAHDRAGGADRGMSIARARPAIDAVRELARERIAPRAAEVDRTAEFPWDAVELLRAGDVFALAFPEEYGGTGTGTLTYLRAVEELSWADATVGLILAVQGLGGLPVLLARHARSRNARTCRAWPAASSSPPTR